MKLFQTFSMVILAIATLSILTSCQDEDFGYTTEDVRAGVYDRNFIKYYGEIPENQSWDFSTSGLFSRLNAAADSLWCTGTRAGSGDEKPTDDDVSLILTYSPSSFNASNFTGSNTNEQKLSAKNAGAFVQSHDLIQWVKKRLQEGGQRLDGLTNKQEFNQRFSMIATEKSFQLIPVFQGIDNTTWDFHVVVDWEDAENNPHSVDRVLWSKSEGMLMIGERPDADGNSHQDHIENFTSVKDLSTLSTNKNQNPNGEVKYETTRLAADIISQTLTVSGYPHGETRARINFYLHMLSGESSDMPTSSTPSGEKKVFWSDGREVENALTSNLVVLPIQVDIPEYQDYEVVLMGCETAFNGDDDMNDIVFLLVGDKDTHKLPELTNLNEIGKRYFFEDLGSVVDWDFNDVVLDLMQVEYLDGSTHKIKQTATLKHRCGTTPFDLFLKNSDGTFYSLNFTNLKDNNGHIPGVNTGDDMEISQTIEIYNGPKDGAYQWREADNNVAIKVYPSLSSYSGVADEATNDGTWSEFHDRYQTGDVHNIPRVFVADQSVWWTSEGQNFPNMWAAPSSAITTRPIGAKPNEFEHSSIYGIGSDRSYRYPRLENGQFILWNTPTRFDHWEPLWLSEGFIEGLNNGYNTINIEFGSVNTNYALLVRQNYKTQDYKSRDFTSVPDSKIVKYTVPTDNFKLEGDLYGGSIQWYLDQVAAGFSPSFGIQDEGDWTGDNGSSHIYHGDEGSWYITINKVWMTNGASADPDPQPDNKNFDITLDQDINFAIPDWGYNGKVSASQLQNINVGDKIVISLSNVNGAQIQIQDMQEWNSIVSAVNLNNGATTYTLNVTNDNINDIKKGIAIMGHGFTITKVSIEVPAQKPTQGTYNFGNADMSFDLDDWSWHVDMANTNFNGKIQNGDVIKITFAKNGGNATLKVPTGSWTEYEALTKDFNSNPATITLTVSDANRSNLETYGLVIQGQGVTFVKAELNQVQPTNSPIELITNGDLEGNNYNNFKYTDAKDNKWSQTVTIVDSQDEHGKIAQISAQRNDSDGQDWDTKFTIDLGQTLPIGTKIKIKFDYKVSENTINIGLGSNNSNGYAEYISEVSFTTNWQTFEKTITTTKELTQIEMSLATEAGVGKTFNFDNISVIKDPSNN